MPDERRIVLFNNGMYSSHEIHIWGRHIPQLKWLLAYVSEESITGSVWRFSYEAQDGKLVLSLCEHKKPHEFIYALHLAAKEAGYETIHSDEFYVRDDMLREEGIIS